MSEFIGRIAVPSIAASGLTFPLTSDFGYQMSQSHPLVVHRFGTSNAKSEQRYQVGIGPRKYKFQRSTLSLPGRNALATFWESIQGPAQSFNYRVPNADQTVTPTTVVWEQAPLSFDYLVHACRVGFTFVELPSTNPSYAVSSTCTRFPSAGLATALLSQVQQIIPLIHIRVREAAVPDIYISDRRCVVGGQQYLPRVLGVGEPGSDVLVTQDIKGSADNVRFTLGNSDGVMTELANDTDLRYATIEFCLYHVNSSTLLQLWAGFIQTFTIDGSNAFVVQASDGIYQVNQQYPIRSLSRSCNKAYNDGINCPWATAGASAAAVIAAGGDPASCDYYYNSANGCLKHGMQDYFGGIPILPQSVRIKDNSTGFIGFDRNTVSATSIVSDTLWGKALADIYCNNNGNLANSFIANALIAAVRDNGDFFDVMGVVGAGPIGGFAITGNSAGQFATNADGFVNLVAPLADGNPAHGLKIASNGTSTSSNSNYGLRQCPGPDPIPVSAEESYQFQLANIVGHNTRPYPQAAGVAFAELLYAKASGISPSTAESHSLTVPLASGLAGWAFYSAMTYGLAGLCGAFTDGSGAVIQPIWIGANTVAYIAPLGATQLQLGINDDHFADNRGSFIVSVNGASHTVNATCMPWSHSGGLNASYPFGINDGSTPVVVSVTPGTLVTLSYVSGTVSAELPTFPYCDGNGYTLLNANGLATGSGTFYPGHYLPAQGRVQQNGMTNPFWIAINTYLRALGLQNASEAVQRARFITPYTGDGSGPAEIADLLVTPLLGSGTETQFQFQGAIGSQKPLRDWLTEILNVGLGWYTFEFGKLKLGCRINASATDAYSVGNIKYQTLTLTPIEAAFEKLVVEFADAASQFQANTAEYQDRDHASYYGRAGAPLTASMHSLGACTLSQALRQAVIRTREEIGGINATEWRNARVAQWETTLLGLSTGVGQVVSVTDSRIPGIRGVCNVDGSGNVTLVSGDPLDSSMSGKQILIAGAQYTVASVTGSPVTSFTTSPVVPAGSNLSFRIITMNVRVQSLQLRKDYSVVLTGKTVTPSMYDVTVGPKPADVAPQPLPRYSYPLPASVAWCPYYVQYPSNDPVFPDEWTFEAQEAQTGTTANGQALTSLVCTGRLPVTTYSIDPPYIGTISQSSTGGSIRGGSLVKVTVCALDANGFPSTPADIALVNVPAGTNTNTITLNSVVWPQVTGLSGYVVFASTRDDLICAQATGALTAGLGGTTYTPSSITLTALARATWAVPNATTGQVVLKAKIERHGGVAGAGVTSVSAGTIVSSDMVDLSGGGFTPVGRVLSLIGRNGSAVPAFNTTITSWTPTTGTIGCSPDPNGIVQAGDVFVIRFKGYDNSATPTQFTDAGLRNSLNGYAGLTAGNEAGAIVRVLSGMGRGERRKLSGNTSTTLSWDEPLVLDASSIVIVESQSWDYRGEATRVDNMNPADPTQLSIQASNLLDEVLLVAGFTVNSAGVESEDADQPVREVWMYGTQATRIVTANTTIVAGDGTVQVDTTAGNVTVTCPSADTMLNQTVIVQKISSDTNSVTITGPAGGYTLSAQWAYLIMRASI